MARTLRLRIFAGPNGSGKSTIIKGIREERVNGRPIDFGAYLNADDIGRELRSVSHYDLRSFGPSIDPQGFIPFALGAGFLGERLDREAFASGYRWTEGRFTVSRAELVDHYAQILVAYLAEELIRAKQKLSLETVFSHPSKLDLMRRAGQSGYKVYLYFISTESPEINVDRVKIRVAQGGHNVPEATIRKRYVASLDQLYPAMHLAYQTFFFDNSEFRSKQVRNAAPFFAHLRFRLDPGMCVWHYARHVPSWFEFYVTDKFGTGLI
jgi:predicted ABC-type ATPase